MGASGCQPMSTQPPRRPHDVQVLIEQLDPELPMPSYSHPGDAGADLYAAESVTLAPGERRLVRTGIAIALPDGYAAFVHPAVACPCAAVSAW